MTARGQLAEGAGRSTVVLGLGTRVDLEAELAHEPSSAWLLVKVGGLLEANLLHGWEAGNAFITEVGDRLKRLTEPEDLVVHLGGNEFAVVLRGSPIEAAEDLRTRAMRALVEPIGVHASRIEPRPTITVSRAPVDVRDPFTFTIEEHNWQGAQRAREQVRSTLDCASTLPELALTAADAGVVGFGLAAVHLTLAGHEAMAGSVPDDAVRHEMFIGAAQQPIGHVAWWSRPAQHDEVPRSTLTMISDELAMAAQRLLALGEADVDPLTGLLNRRGLARATLDLMPPYAVAFVELDDMKRLNDTCGHKTGDLALQCLADTLRSGRSQDIVARWGGDEFVVVLPGATLDEAIGRLNRLLQQLRGDARFGPAGFSFSAGVAEGRGSLETEIETADERMYEAKRTGKSRVVAAIA